MAYAKKKVVVHSSTIHTCINTDVTEPYGLPLEEIEGA